MTTSRRIATLNDTIQTVIRPAMGGVIFAATQAADSVESSTWMQENSWVGIVLGIVLELLVIVVLALIAWLFIRLWLRIRRRRRGGRPAYA
ncbi:MAG: DUF4126 domain-containing protein [Dermatophilaceae bacterium]|nr:DUF4126 domain-containing protein [Intrasporangiaceae bacterium]